MTRRGLELEATVPFDSREAKVTSGLTRQAINVAELHEHGIRSGERRTPGFDHAAKLTRLTRAVTVAGTTGMRQADDNRPIG
jgi:hypothetical protein